MFVHRRRSQLQLRRRIDIRHALLLWSLVMVDLAAAERNVTVDDGDSAIVYAPLGAWAKSAQTDLNSGGSHMLTQNPTATATFSFTGTAVYFLSPLWPYNVSSAISLDSAPPTLVDLVDHSKPDAGQGPESVASHVVWRATGLKNVQHTLIVSVGQGQPFSVLDGLIYTDLSSSSTSPVPTTTGRVVASASSNTASTSKSSKSAVPIALGVVFALLGILIICVGLWYFFRRRKRPLSEAWTSASGSRASAATGTGGLSGPSGTYAGYGYPQQGPPQGIPLAQTSDGWVHPQYAYVGALPPGLPAGQPGPPPSAYVDPSVPPNRAPNRYVPGYTLSTITEKSTPRMGSVGLRTPASTATGALPASNIAGVGAGGAGAYSPASHHTQTISENGYWTPSEVGGYSPPPTGQNGHGQYSPQQNVQPQQQNGHGGRTRSHEKSSSKGSSTWI